MRSCLMAWPLLLSLLLLSADTADSRDVAPQKENYLPDYRHYHNVSAVHQSLKHLLVAHPDRLRLHRTALSSKGLPISVLRLVPRAGPRHGALRVLFVFGEHAREFLPVESCVHLLRHLLDNPAGALSRLLNDHFDLFLVPLLNPDGRRFIERSGNYCWRGTASGVDLERNFPWEFGGSGGSSKSRKDEEYRGPRPLSEPESQLIGNLSQEVHFDAFISFHSGIRHIYIPFSDSKSRATGRRPSHWALMERLTARMQTAMGDDPHHAFKSGPASRLNEYPSDGTLFDFMAGVRKVPVSLTVELWGVGDLPKLACFDLFNPVSANLKEELHRLLTLYNAFFTNLWSLRTNLASPSSTSSPEVTTVRSSVPPYPLVALFGCLILIVGFYVCKQRLRSSSTPWRVLTSGRKRVISLRSFSSRFSSLTSLKSV